VKKLFGFRYWIGGALVGIALISFVAYEQHCAAEEYKHHRAEYCSALIATAEQKKSCIEERASAQDYLPWGYELFRWPEGITTWAIILTGFAIVWQSNETRRAANAALLNAEAVIKAERAWVMIDIEWQVGVHILKSEGTKGNSTAIFVNFICRNEGKSFAQITEKGYVFQIVQTLPQEPEFSQIDIFHHASEYISPDSSTVPYQLHGITGGHLKSSNMMVLYGRVKYTDVYGEHETRFAYQITDMGNLDRFPVSSYPEYNKHT
jgi:hypothetical protein